MSLGWVVVVGEVATARWGEGRRKQTKLRHSARASLSLLLLGYLVVSAGGIWPQRPAACPWELYLRLQLKDLLPRKLEFCVVETVMYGCWHRYLKIYLPKLILIIKWYV